MPIKDQKKPAKGKGKKWGYLILYYIKETKFFYL
jgi:hypothetical protein